MSSEDLNSAPKSDASTTDSPSTATGGSTSQQSQQWGQPQSDQSSQPQWGSQPQDNQQPWSQPQGGQPQWGQQQGQPQQWGQAQGNPQQQQWGQPNQQQWGGQPQGGQQQWGQPEGQPNQQQWGQPQGQPNQQQWGQPNQQQWGQPQGQPNPQQQWGQPQGNPQQQWNQPNQQQWGQPQQAPNQKQSFNMPKVNVKLPDWLGLFYAFQLLLTFLFSFLGLASYKGSIDGVGSIGLKINWWGNVSLTHSGYGRYADNFFTQGYIEELNEEAGGGWMIFVALLILALYGAATYFAVTKKWKPAAMLGAAAGAIQLIEVIVLAVQVKQEGFSLGAAWWFWLLISLVTLGVSIALIVLGKDKFDAKINQTRANVSNGAGTQSSASNDAPNQSGSTAWNQQKPNTGGSDAK
ncbi:hypothetical protein JKI95_10300 [Corynebacterium aquatimens]|uniref:hypothetical protein n=1 Tax=Corynebacterium aquatimens TaxID=1190508 RepID=UPI00253FA3BE|nr:hypothetical protein [Corynebacterium aquatimens]QYH19460.1 hypothetical protein JKI95_10300 [Corynebacterium aquatimens]